MILSLLFLLLHFTEASDQGVNTVKEVKPGDDVLLDCHSPRPGVISLVEWSRADLDSDGYVYFYRDERVYRKFQHPSFVDRVELRDPTMKDGDVSVYVNHVTAKDTGTYQCYVSTINNNGRRKRESVSRTIKLLVVEKDSGDVDGATATWSRGHAGGPAAALILVAAVVAIAAVVIRHKKHKQSSAVCRDAEENNEQLV